MFSWQCWHLHQLNSNLIDLSFVILLKTVDWTNLNLVNFAKSTEESKMCQPEKQSEKCGV